GKGPVASGRPKKNPGASSGAARLAVELLPDETPSTSGSPNSQETSMVIGTVPRAATVSALVLVGTSQFGWAFSDSGSVTLFTPDPSSSCGTRPSRRASAKKSFLMLPVLVMVMVAVTGFPGASRVRDGAGAHRGRGERDRPGEWLAEVRPVAGARVQQHQGPPAGCRCALEELHGPAEPEEVVTGVEGRIRLRVQRLAVRVH